MVTKKPPKCCHPNCEQCPYADCQYDAMQAEDYQDKLVDELLFPVSEEQQKARDASNRYAEKHREEIRERSRKYYQDHVEQCNERARKWQTENRDRVNALQRKRWAENPEYYRQKQREYKKRAKGELPPIEKTEDKIFRFIVSYIQAHGYSPGIKEIADGVGIKSNSGVTYQLEKLYAQGRLETDTEHKEHRAIRVPGYKFVKIEETEDKK